MYTPSKLNVILYLTMCGILNRLKATLSWTVIVAHEARAYPSFCNIETRSILLPPGWDASALQGYALHYTGICWYWELIADVWYAKILTSWRLQVTMVILNQLLPGAKFWIKITAVTGSKILDQYNRGHWD